MEKVGNIIKTKRMSLGLSLLKLTNRANVSYNTALAIEKGKHTSTATVTALLNVLGMELTAKEKGGDNS